MSKTVGMVPIFAPRHRRTGGPTYTCTACGRTLHTITAVLAGKVRPDALACSGCGRLGVHCDCGRLA